MAPATPSLQVSLFGPFDARVNGHSLPRLRSRKGHWLLALLALRAGCSVERSWLAGTLWPDSPDPQAFANLRNTLKDLRHALGSEACRLLSPTTRTLMLDPDGAAVDVLAFDAAVARGDIPSLEQAVALYYGPLLEGCDEEWVAEERRVREQAYLAGLEALAGHTRARGDLASAERHLRQAVAAEPLRESAQRALMQALAAGGSYAAALQTYRELRELLHRELNAQPDPETQALFQRLRGEAARSGALSQASGRTWEHGSRPACRGRASDRQSPAPAHELHRSRAGGGGGEPTPHHTPPGDAHGCGGLWEDPPGAASRCRAAGRLPTRRLSLLGWMAHMQDQPETARVLLEESLALYRVLGDREGLVELLNDLGALAYRTGDLDTAWRLWEECIALCRELEDRVHLLGPVGNLVLVARYREDDETARRLALEWLALARELQNWSRITLALDALGELAYAQGDLDAARRYWEEALATATEQEIAPQGLLNNLGRLACVHGEHAAARTFHQEALAVARALSRDDFIRPWRMAVSWTGLGEAACAEGDLATARAVFREGLAEWQKWQWPEALPKFGPKMGCARCLDGLAKMAAKQGQTARAARGFGAAAALREALDARLPQPEATRWEQDVAEVRATLGQEAFAAAWAEGRAMTLAEAIEHALDETPKA